MISFVIATLFSWWALPITLLCCISSILYSHFVKYSSLRRLPGDNWAKVTNLPMFLASYQGKALEHVVELHERRGKIVRIQPNHVSIADDAAIPLIYGYKGGLVKADAYDAFLVGRPNIFTTKDKSEHSRKRKYVSHAYSATSMSQFEPYIRARIEVFTKKLDEFAVKAEISKDPGDYTFDITKWLHYLSFDVISDLVFGVPFGMLDNGADLAELKDPRKGSVFVPAIKAIELRQRVNHTLGHMLWIRPLAKYIPLEGLNGSERAATNLAGIASARVSDRLENPPLGRDDILSEMINGQEKVTGKIDKRELIEEAISHMVAGSDTTSSSLSATIFFVSKDTRVYSKLMAELDEVSIPDGTTVPSYSAIKGLPYLHNVIRETLRVHSLVGIGLPRQIPLESQGLSLQGYHLAPGTVVSIPAHIMHHSREIWGHNADEFVPERWDTATERQKAAFMPFSIGPRSCIGRNLAEMEMAVVLVAFFKRYTLHIGVDKFTTTGGLAQRPMSMPTVVRRR